MSRRLSLRISNFYFLLSSHLLPELHPNQRREGIDTLAIRDDSVLTFPDDMSLFKRFHSVSSIQRTLKIISKV